uniref:RING-type domain-containing protein n=1 Tax=viral metagenome TaxID=1070528 RepID=A0A6C0CPI3_9ZZZZ
MSLAVDTGRNNNRDITWLENDNSIEMPLSPVTSDSSNDSSSSQETSFESSDVENQIVSRYVPPSPLSENETINPFVIGCINNILDNCNTSVVPFRDSTNIIGTISHEIQQYDLDCPICFDPLDTSDVITMDCCRKQLHLNCIKQWHIKNVDLETRKLCIMCRTNSELMTDIYNTIRVITVYDDDDDDDHNDEHNFNSNNIIIRRRRRRRNCDDTFQHALCSIVFLITIVLFVVILNGNIINSNESNYNRTSRHP